MNSDGMDYDIEVNKHISGSDLSNQMKQEDWTKESKQAQMTETIRYHQFELLTGIDTKQEQKKRAK